MLIARKLTLICMGLEKVTNVVNRSYLSLKQSYTNSRLSSRFRKLGKGTLILFNNQIDAPTLLFLLSILIKSLKKLEASALKLFKSRTAAPRLRSTRCVVRPLRRTSFQPKEISFDGDRYLVHTSRDKLRILFVRNLTRSELIIIMVTN